MNILHTNTSQNPDGNRIEPMDHTNLPTTYDLFGNSFQDAVLKWADPTPDGVITAEDQTTVSAKLNHCNRHEFNEDKLYNGIKIFPSDVLWEMDSQIEQIDGQLQETDAMGREVTAAIYDLDSGKKTYQETRGELVEIRDNLIDQAAMLMRQKADLIVMRDNMADITANFDMTEYYNRATQDQADDSRSNTPQSNSLPSEQPANYETDLPVIILPANADANAATHRS